MRIAFAAALAVAAAGLAPGAANASEIIDRNATRISLKVNKSGQALVEYNARGRRWHVLAWGAINARDPNPTVPQVKFRLDYAGGWGTYRREVWRSFRTACRPYDGPRLSWFVMGCKAPDGSYWALQAWQRMLPNYGLRPTAKQAVWELRLSHWSGELPQLSMTPNWAYRRYDHVFGRYSYRGKPVHGFRSTSTGVPLDTYGRNIYVDTYDSAYGPGWKRENSFLAHRGNGKFCYGFYPHGDRPSGMGARYRATVIGPGVTPDVTWEGVPLGAYDRELDLALHEQQREFYSDDGVCRPV